MAIFTSSYLKSRYSSSLITEQKQTFSNIDKSQLKFDIFLSHSFLDRDEVLGLYRELTDIGFKVYVDWIVDPELDRSNVTKATAELIRNRMRNSKTLLLAISTNATMSKWMPWELGYVDGKRGRCAIVPVSKDNNNLSSYNRVEYLKLYPYIQKRTLKNTNIYINYGFGKMIILMLYSILGLQVQIHLKDFKFINYDKTIPRLEHNVRNEKR